MVEAIQGVTASNSSKDESPSIILDGGLRYKGPVRAQVPHGIGKLIWPNGDFYQGEFRNGKRHG